MTYKTAVVYTCAHATPECSNERFDWLGSFLYDLKPDYVVDLGDGADLKSLNVYDKSKPKAIANSPTYEQDIECYNDAQERVQWKFRHNKRRMPDFFGFEGNHENRIARAIETDPRLEGSKNGISFSDLQTDKWFTEYHRYDNGAPAEFVYDGVCYAHYFSGGNSGRPISGTHHGHALLQKRHGSATCGHAHIFDYKVDRGAYPNPIHGLVAGSFKGKDESWAGQSNRMWSRGVAVKRYLKDGDYNLQWVSMEQLRVEYGEA